MTRKMLGSHLDERTTFRGTFERYGAKTGWHGTITNTVLLVNIVDSQNQPVCDHLWFNYTKAFARLDIRPGDLIEFDGRVSEYTKGLYTKRKDYKISYPTHVHKVDQPIDKAKK